MKFLSTNKGLFPINDGMHFSIEIEENLTHRLFISYALSFEKKVPIADVTNIKNLPLHEVVEKSIKGQLVSVDLG